MRQHTHYRLATLLFLLAGCSDSATAPKSTAAAADFANTVTGFTNVVMSASAPMGRMELPCPGGGMTIVDGTSTPDGTGDVRTSSWQISIEQRDCTIKANDVTIVISGSAHSEGLVTLRIAAQPQLIRLESHDFGQMTTKANGQTTTCSFDLHQSYDTAKQQLHITGTACGLTVDSVRPMS